MVVHQNNSQRLLQQHIGQHNRRQLCKVVSRSTCCTGFIGLLSKASMAGQDLLHAMASLRAPQDNLS